MIFEKLNKEASICLSIIKARKKLSIHDLHREIDGILIDYDGYSFENFSYTYLCILEIESLFKLNLIEIHTKEGNIVAFDDFLPMIDTINIVHTMLNRTNRGYSYPNRYATQPTGIISEAKRKLMEYTKIGYESILTYKG